MEVRKLYYEDCHLNVFTAAVTSCRETEKGFLICLDATAFYPEGGGQACDLGTLGDARVLDVQESGDQIMHLCDKALPVGEEVTGRIDWERRFDLMQQHTGEHIVSGIIHEMFGCHNVGFHMGADVITIDFDAPIPQEALAQIEKRANQAVFRNLPVQCWYPAPDELPNVTYRTKRALPWPVRIVRIPEYDSCACCGVHVAFTGEIGIIKLFSCVKFHQGVRLEMACGARALDILTRVYEQNRLVSQAFSAKLMETGAAAQRMNEALAAEKSRAIGLERQLFDTIATGFADRGDVAYFDAALTPAAVRELAERIAQCCGGTAAVFSGSDETGYSVCLVNKTAPVAELGKALIESLSGRGGGKPGFFQGSVRVTRDQIGAFLQKKQPAFVFSVNSIR